MRCHRFQVVLVIAVAMLVSAGSASAAIVFSEDFESPDVNVYSEGVLPTGGNWVGANQGYGSGRRGITDKVTGDFSTADSNNHQAFAFRYTNSGLTTAESVIGNLNFGSTYTISFDVVQDAGLNDGRPYTAQLIAFDAGDARNDARGTPTNSTMLGSASGNAPDDGSFATVSFSFTPDAVNHALDLGNDLGVRFIGATTSAIIDNVSVDVFTPVIVDTTPPTPDPLTWEIVPTGVDFESVTMRATQASDANGAEYYFTNTTNGNNSGWQYFPEWFDTGLNSNSTYTYEVKARDLSPDQNETVSSSALSATTLVPIPGLIFYDSFEDPDIIRSQGTNPTGWVTGGGGYDGLEDEENYRFTTPYDGQAAWVFDAVSTSGTVGGRNQSLTTDASILNETLQADTTYELSFNTATTTGSAFPIGYRVRLMAIDDDTGLATELAQVIGTVDTTDMSTSDSILFEPDISHAALLGQRLAIQLRKDIGDWHYNVLYDNVALVAISAVNVPEPSSFVLAALGFLGLGFIGCRRFGRAK